MSASHQLLTIGERPQLGAELRDRVHLEHVKVVQEDLPKRQERLTRAHFWNRHLCGLPHRLVASHFAIGGKPRHASQGPMNGLHHSGGRIEAHWHHCEGDQDFLFWWTRSSHLTACHRLAEAEPRPPRRWQGKQVEAACQILAALQYDLVVLKEHHMSIVQKGQPGHVTIKLLQHSIAHGHIDHEALRPIASCEA